MVTTLTGGAKEFYMVNSDDPDRACQEVLHYTGGKVAEALTELSDETLDHYQVKPNEPWLCFRGDPSRDRIWGDGYGVSQTAFSDDKNIEEVGRCELRNL